MTSTPGRVEMAGPEIEQVKNKIAESLSGVRIGFGDLREIPAPPASPGARLGISLGGLMVASCGLWMFWFFVLTWSAILPCVGLGTIGYGLGLILFGQYDSPLARQAMPKHPSSREGDTRSLWETLMTLAVVLAIGNVPVLLVLVGLSLIVLPWSAGLLLALAGNALLLWAGWRGDGINRRPVEAVPLPPPTAPPA